MNSQDLGPGWKDVSDYVEHLRGTNVRGIGCRLVPPAKRFNGHGWTPWGVVVFAEHPTKPFPGQISQRAYWGSGGTWRTAPAALHAALRALEDDIESWRRGQVPAGD